MKWNEQSGARLQDGVAMRGLIALICALALYSPAPAGAGPLEDIANVLKQSQSLAEQARKAAEAARQGAPPVGQPANPSQPPAAAPNSPGPLPGSMPPGSQGAVPCIALEPPRPHETYRWVRNTCASSILMITWGAPVNKCVQQSMKSGVIAPLYGSMADIRAVCSYNSITPPGSCECAPGTAWPGQSGAQAPSAAPAAPAAPVSPKASKKCAPNDGQKHRLKPCDNPAADREAGAAQSQGAGHVADDRVTADRIALGAQMLPAGTYAGHGPRVGTSPLACTVTVTYDQASSRYTVSVAPALNGVPEATFSMIAGMPISCYHAGVTAFNCSNAPARDNDNARRFSYLLTRSQSLPKMQVEIEVKKNKMPSRAECYINP